MLKHLIEESAEIFEFGIKHGEQVPEEKDAAVK